MASKDGKSKRKPVITAIVIGVLIAVAAGIVINATMPRNTYASDIIHPPQSVTVTIPANKDLGNENPSFEPKVVRVVLGVNNTIVWVNKGNSPDRVVGEDETIDFGKVKGLIQPEESWSFTFTEKGTYNYLSDIHPWLQGTIIVE